MVLNFGEKLAEGAPEDVRNHPEVIKAYLGDSESL
jgi:branched-chain amino acid transport system ATP-binding protein